MTGKTFPPGHLIIVRRGAVVWDDLSMGRGRALDRSAVGMVLGCHPSPQLERWVLVLLKGNVTWAWAESISAAETW